MLPFVSFTLLSLLICFLTFTTIVTWGGLSTLTIESNSVLTVDGNMTGTTLFVTNGILSRIFALFLNSTLANISTLNFTDSPSHLVVEGSHTPSIISVGLLPVDCSQEYNINNKIELDMGVMATFYGPGSICNLSISDNVIVNFSAGDVV